MLYVQKQQHEDKKIEAANFKLLCKYSKMAIFKIQNLHFLFIYLLKLKYFVLFYTFKIDFYFQYVNYENITSCI